MGYDYETAAPDRYELLKDFARHNRREMTESETVLWNALREMKAGIRFRRQHPIGDYIADFICLPAKLVIEVDGGYYHSDPRVVDENHLNPMQKHNKRIDEYKNAWALSHGIPILRIWEKDIRESPSRVLDELKSILGLQSKKMSLLENKNKRHKNKIK